MNRKTLLWAGLGIIVIAVIGVAINSPFPPRDELAGAIGVAKQYRAEQITDADVVLEDPGIQELLQSDFFYKLATDKEFRKIAVDQLARMDMASGRSALVSNRANLADMENFLSIVVDNSDLKMALAEGRMDVVRKILVQDGRAAYIDIANRIYAVQGRNAQVNAKAFVEMKAFLDLAKSEMQMRSALVDGRMDVVNRVLIKSGRVELQDAANRILMAESRNLMSGRAFSLVQMRVFLDLAKTNVELRQALVDGRMDMVHKMLLADGRTQLADVADRVYIALGRGPELDSVALDDMRSFVDLAAGSSDLKIAFADGRMEVVNKVLIADGRHELLDAANRVFIADGRGAVNNPADFGDMKAFLDLSHSQVEMRNALADGRMDVVRRILIADGKTHLTDAANRIYQSLGRNQKLNRTALADLKGFVDLAAGNADMRSALTNGRMDVVNRILATNGRTALDDAAGRMFLAVNRSQLSGRVFMADMRVFLGLARSNVEMRNALADGRMDMVNRILATDGKSHLEDAANRVYLGLGRNPKLNLAAIDDMRSFIDAVGGSADLKSALSDGRLDVANRVLMTDGRSQLQDAAGRVFAAAEINNRAARETMMGDMRMVSSFARENVEFRQALQDGRLEMAARVAQAAGKSDISLRGLQVSSFVIGDSRSFAADLGRLVTVADTPSFKQAAENTGWGRMLATTDAATWKSTVESAGDSRSHVQN